MQVKRLTPKVKSGPWPEGQKLNSTQQSGAEKLDAYCHTISPHNIDTLVLSETSVAQLTLETVNRNMLCREMRWHSSSSNRGWRPP